jgi:hypothetical protein
LQKTHSEALQFAHFGGGFALAIDAVKNRDMFIQYPLTPHRGKEATWVTGPLTPPLG